MQMTITNTAGPFVPCLLLAQLFWLKQCVGSGFAWGAWSTKGAFLPGKAALARTRVLAPLEVSMAVLGSQRAGRSWLLELCLS